jgi:preprotein translocase subunit SecG
LLAERKFSKKEIKNSFKKTKEKISKKTKRRKNMKKTTIFGMLAFFLVGLIISTGIASAYKGDYTIKSPDYNEEKCEEMQEAFETKDYDKWNEVMKERGKNSKVMSVLNENNFETFVQAREAGKNGDYETALRLRSELGLNDGNGLKDGTGYGKTNGKGKNIQQKMNR